MMTPSPSSSSWPPINPPSLYSALRWLRSGWRSFCATLWPSLFYGCAFVGGGFLLIWTLIQHPSYVPAVIGGFLILGPFLTLGIYGLARQYESGVAIDLRLSMMTWRQNKMNLSLFCFMLTVIFIIWIRASFVAFAVFTSGPLLSVEDIIIQALQHNSWAFLFTYFAIGSVFAALAFAISVVTVPLIFDRDMDAIPAALTSVRLCVLYPYPLIVWAICIAVLGILGLSVMLLGIIVIGPWLGHATWYAYRDMIQGKFD